MTPYLQAIEDFSFSPSHQDKIAMAADYISLGDVSNTFIRNTENWSLEIWGFVHDMP